MNRLLALTLLLGAASACCAFTSEADMQAGLMQMLARFTTYVKNDFQPCVEPNSVGEACGCFKGENTMAADERGVRPNADLSMVCAFLVKYGKGTFRAEATEAAAAPQRVVLPDGVSWADLEDMAMKSLVFAYSTHKANRLKACAGGKYWGSTSVSDASWESSLWAMSVAYSAFFQWERLTEQQRGYIYRMLRAECNYELERDIPTAYAGDTKAEENGWEADVLAATLGLFPDDPLAPRWFERMREFAVNSYSHRKDATDSTVIDPGYDTKTVAQLYRGQNLYDDYTLQNHNYFHTSYQNVVIQELGEAALALKLFQRGLHGRERWHSNALMHNCQSVMDEVLYWLALSDGELAMPNGNDWSLFLYDQITSYATSACFLRDPHALMLERLAYSQIRSRQATTADGSWLLRPDVGARRMGVQAHRVMMTWLMHHLLPTADIKPTSWSHFNRQYGRAKVLPAQNIVRASTGSRFTCFSWSEGLKSYTGYIAPHSDNFARDPHEANLIVPFRQNNTGNLLGWYDVEGRKANAKPVVSGNYLLDGNAWAMNGELLTNDGALDMRFAVWSTPGNAVVYHDLVMAREPCAITSERGALTAVSVDGMTRMTRTIYSCDGQRQLDGSTLTTMNGPWVNVDNALGITTWTDKEASPSGGRTAFGERSNNNSVLTARLYALYSDQRRELAAGQVADRRSAVYYTGVNAAATADLATHCTQLAAPTGWQATIAADTDSTRYLLLSNFAGEHECRIENVVCREGKPVFAAKTMIGEKGATATLSAAENTSLPMTIHFFIKGSGVEAWQAGADPATIFLRNTKKGKNTITLSVFAGGKRLDRKVTLGKKTITMNSQLLTSNS